MSVAPGMGAPSGVLAAGGGPGGGAMREGSEQVLVRASGWTLYLLHKLHSVSAAMHNDS